MKTLRNILKENHRKNVRIWLWLNGELIDKYDSIDDALLFIPNSILKLYAINYNIQGYDMDLDISLEDFRKYFNF